MQKMKRECILVKYGLAAIVILACLALFYKCPFEFFFGIPCMGCGMTRAMLACLRLDFVSAFYYHPLFGVVIVTAGFWLLDKMGIYKMKQSTQKICLTIVCILFVLVYILRLLGHSPVVQIDIKKEASGMIVGSIPAL